MLLVHIQRYVQRIRSQNWCTKRVLQKKKFDIFIESLNKWDEFRCLSDDHRNWHIFLSSSKDSPSGEVTKTRFATIFGTLFPSGGGRKLRRLFPSISKWSIFRMFSLLVIHFSKHRSIQHGFYSFRRSSFQFIDFDSRHNRRKTRLDFRSLRFKQRRKTHENSSVSSNDFVVLKQTKSFVFRNYIKLSQQFFNWLFLCVKLIWKKWITSSKNERINYFK